MLNKGDLPYCVTVLSQGGKTLLLKNNSAASFDYFSFTDNEINHNLFNDDNKKAWGFDHVSSSASDTIFDISSQMIFEPGSRFFDGASFLFGNTVPHQLTQAQLTTEDDLLIDMSADPIVDEADEIIQIQLQRQKDIFFTIFSGNYGTFTLDNSSLQSWSILVDIRAIVTTYSISGNNTYQENTSDFSNESYHIDFLGGTVETSFSYDQQVNPTQSLLISTADLKANHSINFPLYGTFNIIKTIEFQGITYHSEILSITLQQPDFIAPTPILDAKKNLLPSYTYPYRKKKIFIDGDFENKLISPQILGSYLNDQVSQQAFLNGYVDLLPEPLPLRIRSSSINMLNLTLVNINNNSKSFPLLSIQGDSVDPYNFITIPLLDITLTLRRQVSGNGYYVIPTISFPDNFGVLEQNEISSQVCQYLYFNDFSKKITITVYNPIFLGTQSQYETAPFSDKLWRLNCDDHTPIYNYKQNRILTQEDFQTLILYTH